ncbi:MAG: STAS domain-containing protein [Chloroflexia bacterium]|nr:STAS domain-containing protein [Chloroflexia bacterium]
MSANKLEVAVRRRSGVAVVDLRGEINAFAEEALNAAYAEADGQAPHTILLNFEKVDYINSTGIALIVGLLTRSRSASKRLAVCGLSDHYREIFAITRLADFMPVFRDEPSAMVALNDGAPPNQRG